LQESKNNSLPKKPSWPSSKDREGYSEGQTTSPEEPWSPLLLKKIAPYRLNMSGLLQPKSFNPFCQLEESMKPQDVSEAKLAWMIWQALEKLNGLLWDRYEKDFLSFGFDKKDRDEKSTTSDMEQIDGSFSEDSTSFET
jgi:hypothetical protein